MGRETLETALAPLFAALKDADPDDRGLAARLSASFPVNGPVCAAVRAAAAAGLVEGWFCNRENGGVRFSRPVKPSPASNGYSVDAVVMDRVSGPRHTHTNGEINLCFTDEGDAKFCGHGEGWVVFGKGSTHVPVVSDGRMTILYFLPGGAIEFHA
ncbi:MAG: DUF4863 family protein [Planctomycetes bacterium]|nr:DUF4863 family protein [Planctomycetota bacterium]